MRQVVVYAFYAWCAISLIAIVVYTVRRRSGSDVDHEAASQPDSSSIALFDEADAAASPLEEEPAELLEPAPTTLEPAPTKAEPDTLEVPALSTIAAEAATAESTVPPTEVPLGESAPTAATPMAAAAAAQLSKQQPPKKSLAELLAGIALPYDLLPIIPDHDGPSEEHVSLLTSSAPVDVVGPAVADELERLGYRLEPLSESELLATRDNDALTLAMVTSPTTAERGGKLVYPQANDGDVVVTIDINND